MQVDFPMSPQGFDRKAVEGVAYSIAAFSIWGFVPLFFKLMQDIPAAEILAHRILWTTLYIFLMLVVMRRLRNPALLWRDKATLIRLAFAALFIGVNWLVFLWGVLHERVLETSLGYFINPLVSVLLGVAFLGERLRPAQIAAVGIAVLGIGVLVVSLGTLPWISLVLAFAFGFYGLLKKQVDLDAMNGLFMEMAMLSPLCIAWIVRGYLAGDASFATGSGSYNLLLPLSGMVTLVPLLCFGAGARRIQLSTVGFIQYLAPSMTFCLAVFVFGEPFGRAQLVTFVLIWVSLAIYTADSLQANHRRRRELRPVGDAG